MVMTRGSQKREQNQHQQQEETQHQQKRPKESLMCGLQPPLLLPTKVVPSPLNCPAQPQIKFPQSVGSSLVAKRVRDCETLTEAVLEATDSLDPAKIPSQLIPCTQKSESNMRSACHATVAIPLIKSPLQGKVSPQTALRRYPLRRAIRVPCIRDKTTAVMGTAKKEINDSESDGAHSEGTCGNGVNALVVPLGLEVTQEIQSITSVPIPLETVVDNLVSINKCTVQTTDVNDHASGGEVTMATSMAEETPEVSANCPGDTDSNAMQTTSVNLSGMAQVLDDDCSSFNSELKDALVTVDGYRVKQDMVPFLRDILSKYGDIASHCCKKSVVFRSLLLENVCSVVQVLQTAVFMYLTPSEINNLQVLVHDIEADGVEVGWLLQRLDEILESKRLVKESPQLKKARSHIHHTTKRMEEEIQTYEEHICKLQEKMDSLKDELIAARLQVQKYDETLAHTKALAKRFHCGSMVDDLL